MGTGYQQEQECTYRNSSVGCGCSDSLVVALLLLAVPLLAAVVWRQQDSAVNLKMGFSFSVEIQWVLIGLVLSLTTGCVSYRVETRLVLDTSPVHSLSGSTLIACVQIYFFFWVQTGPSAADPAGSSFLGKKSMISWACSAGNFPHLIYTKLSSSVLSEFDGKCSVILILFSTCMWKMLF